MLQSVYSGMSGDDIICIIFPQLFSKLDLIFDHSKLLASLLRSGSHSVCADFWLQDFHSDTHNAVFPCCSLKQALVSGMREGVQTVVGLQVYFCIMSSGWKVGQTAP